MRYLHRALLAQAFTQQAFLLVIQVEGNNCKYIQNHLFCDIGFLANAIAIAGF